MVYDGAHHNIENQSAYDEHAHETHGFWWCWNTGAYTICHTHLNNLLLLLLLHHVIFRGCARWFFGVEGQVRHAAANEGG